MQSHPAEKINLHELIYDIGIMVSQFIYHFLSGGEGLFIRKLSHTGIIISLFCVSLFFTYYIAKIAKSFKSYESSRYSPMLFKAVYITYFVVGTVISCGIYLYLKHFGYINTENEYKDAILIISTILMVVTGFSAGVDIVLGFILVVLFVFIYIWSGGIYLFFSYLVNNCSCYLSLLIFKTAGFIFMFGFPVLTALLYFRLTDSFSENIRKTFYVLKTATESRIFHILSAMFFSFIFNIWAELYYGIVIDHIESTPGRISFLIFSGVVPVRVLLLLQPPFKRLNFIFGIAAVIFFIARYTR